MNSKDVTKRMVGLPSPEQMVSGQNTDNLDATIVDPSTGEEGPATLTEGEYVFDVPSIIGIGDGDYETGLQKLQQIHQALQQKGLGLMDAQQQQPSPRR